MDGANPGMLRSVFVDDGGGAVGGTIIDDYPLDGANGLMNHALDGEAKIGFFIANGRDDQVFVCLKAHGEIFNL
jgi:hypothetical protein